MNMIVDIRVAQNGRMVLPQSARKALGLADGGTILLSVDGDEVKLSSVQKSIRHAQQLYLKHAILDQSADDFIRERRDEAARSDER